MNPSDLPTDWVDVRKRPVTVEARRLDDRREIETREGTLVGEPGDLLVRGVEGEVYPVDPDVFAETYESVSAVDVRQRREQIGRIVTTAGALGGLLYGVAWVVDQLTLWFSTPALSVLGVIVGFAGLLILRASR